MVDRKKREPIQMHPSELERNPDLEKNAVINAPARFLGEKKVRKESEIKDDEDSFVENPFEWLDQENRKRIELIKSELGQKVKIRVQGKARTRIFRLTDNDTGWILFTQLLEAYKRNGDQKSLEKLFKIFPPSSRLKMDLDKKLSTITVGKTENQYDISKLVGEVESVENIADARKSNFEPAEFPVKVGDKIEISNMRLQQSLVEGIYEVLLPGLTPDTFEQMQAEKPDHLVFKVAAAFSFQPGEDPDWISSAAIDKVKGIVEVELAADDSKNKDDLELVHRLILELANTPPTQTLVVTKFVDKGTYGVVVNAEVQQSDKAPQPLDDLSTDHFMLKILYPTVGQEGSVPTHDETDEVVHLSRIRDLLKGVPLSVRYSLALPKTSYRAKVFNQRGFATETTMFELEEASGGVSFSDWKPDSLEEYVAVLSQIAWVVDYLHSYGIYNVDSGNPFIFPDKLKKHLQKPDLDNMGFVVFYDLDGSMIHFGKKHKREREALHEPTTELTDSAAYEKIRHELETSKHTHDEVVYPLALEAGQENWGKAENANFLLINRDADKYLDWRAGELADSYNFVVQIINSMIGGDGLVHILPVSTMANEKGCHYDLKDTLRLRTNQYFAAVNFVDKEMKEYPLISFDSFKNMLQKPIFDIGDDDARTIYQEFKKFFNIYHKATVQNARYGVVVEEVPDFGEVVMNIVHIFQKYVQKHYMAAAGD